MQLLSDFAAGDNAKRAVEVKAMLNAMDCQFVLMLLFMGVCIWSNTAIDCHVAVYRYKFFWCH